MGIFGAAISQMVCEIFALFINLIIMKMYCLKETIGVLNSKKFFKKIFFHAWESLKFAFSVCFEAISTEMNTVFTSLLHKAVYLAAYTRWINYMFIFYSIGFGMGIIMRTRISYLIGRNQKLEAKRFFFWNVGFHTIFGLIVSII